MGPLLPITLLLGSMWYLDREQERGQGQAVGGGPIQKTMAPPPTFSPIAVSRVTQMVGTTRVFQPGVHHELETLLRSSGIEVLALEGTPVGAHIFKLVPLTPGGATAGGMIDAALRSGQVVLGSLALALGGTPDQQLLLVGNPEVKSYANGRGVFAVLADRPAVVAAPEPEAPAEEPVRVAPKHALRKLKTNGVAPAPVETVIVEAEESVEG